MLALAAAGLIFTTTLGAQQAREYFDPVLEPGAFCGGNDGKQPALIKTVRGSGYVFSTTVTPRHAP